MGSLKTSDGTRLLPCCSRSNGAKGIAACRDITSREVFDLANGSLFNVIGIAFIVWLLSANVD